MNKRRNTYNKDAVVKRLIFTVSIAFIAVVFSAVAAHYTSRNLSSKEPETLGNNEIYTKLAEVPKTDIPDERIFNNDSSANITEEPTTKQQTTEAKKEVTETQTKAPETKPVNNEFVLPLTGEVTKAYSKTQMQYSETMNDWRVHLGADFAGKDGDEVCSVGNGVVTKVYADSKWGYVIEIDYGTFTGRYCGLSQDGAVGINQKVSTGDVLGKLTYIPIEKEEGIHLHFEALKASENIDPFEALGQLN